MNDCLHAVYATLRSECDINGVVALEAEDSVELTEFPAEAVAVLISNESL